MGTHSLAARIFNESGAEMEITKNQIATCLAAFGVVMLMGCEQSQPARLSSLGSASPSGSRRGTPQSDFRFEDPVRIFAGDDPVSVDSPGYACPTIADVDGDGADDLVVGQFASGKMKFYRNENQPGQTPKFSEGIWINNGDEVANVPGVW